MTEFLKNLLWGLIIVVPLFVVMTGVALFPKPTMIGFLVISTIVFTACLGWLIRRMWEDLR